MSSNRGHRAGQCAPEVPRTRIRARGDLQERRTRPIYSHIQHPTPAPLPGSSLIWRRYGGGVCNRGRWADRFAISEQRQSMERHFQRSRELFRTDRGRPCPREWEDPQAKRCGGMERSGSLCGRGYRSAEAAAAASGSSCELANPAQVCQIASQTGVLFSAR